MNSKLFWTNHKISLEKIWNYENATQNYLDFIESNKNLKNEIKKHNWINIMKETSELELQELL